MGDPVRVSSPEEMLPPIEEWCGATPAVASEDARSSRSADSDAVRLPSVRDLLPGYCGVPFPASQLQTLPNPAFYAAFSRDFFVPARTVPLFSDSVPQSARRLFSCFPFVPCGLRSGILRRRFPKRTTQLLAYWLRAHSADPYPTESQKRALCRESGLSVIQLNDWLANYRRRHMIHNTKRKGESAKRTADNATQPESPSSYE